MKIEPLPPPAPSLESEVHRRLRDLIVSGELVPGALYSIFKVAAASPCIPIATEFPPVPSASRTNSCCCGSVNRVNASPDGVAASCRC